MWNRETSNQLSSNRVQHQRIYLSSPFASAHRTVSGTTALRARVLSRDAILSSVPVAFGTLASSVTPFALPHLSYLLPYTCVFLFEIDKTRNGFKYLGNPSNLRDSEKWTLTPITRRLGTTLRVMKNPHPSEHVVEESKILNYPILNGASPSVEMNARATVAAVKIAIEGCAHTSILVIEERQCSSPVLRQ